MNTLPIEIINKILIMRGIHPNAILIKKYYEDEDSAISSIESTSLTGDEYPEGWDNLWDEFYFGEYYEGRHDEEN